MIKSSTFAILPLIFLSLIWGCKEDGGSNGGGTVPGQAISGIWAINDTADAVVPEGEQKITEAGDFVGFRLTITPSLDEVAYTTQGTISPVIFPAQGRLEVEEEDDFQAGAEVVRYPDLVPMNMTVYEADSLLVEFSIDFDSSIPAENSRQLGITGSYRLWFMKQQ